MDKCVDVLIKYKFLNSTHVVPTYTKKLLWMLSFCVSLNELENVDKLGLTFLIIKFINSLKNPSMCCEHIYVTISALLLKCPCLT